MKKIIKYSVVLIIFISIMFIFPSLISASEDPSFVESKNINGDIVGKISIDDDYKVEVLYKYRLKDLSVKVCKGEKCEELAPQGQTYLNNPPYEEMGVWSKSLSEYLVKETEVVEYSVTITGNFKPTLTATFGSSITLNKTIVVDPTSLEDDDKSEEVMLSLEKVIKVCNTWIIPGLYIILAVIFVVKSILLTVDIVRYSDNVSVRKEKIRAFVYLGISLLCIAGINTGVAFLTGLFK